MLRIHEIGFGKLLAVLNAMLEPCADRISRLVSASFTLPAIMVLPATVVNAAPGPNALAALITTAAQAHLILRSLELVPTSHPLAPRRSSQAPV